MSMNVTDAFNAHLAKRRENIMKMFTNPEDALGDEVIKAEDVEEIDETEEVEEKSVKKGCGDGDREIKKEMSEEEMEEEDEDEPNPKKVMDDEEDDEKTDAEKAEIITLIGIDQLDVWKSQIDELALDKDIDETEKAETISRIDEEIQDLADITNIKKSDILYALSGYESKIKFRKTGKEIKEQLNSQVIPALNSELAVAKSEADEVLKECGDAPTHDVPEYWTGDLHIEMPYKFYEWDETTVPENSNSIISSFSPDSYQKRCCKNAPATQEEADARCKYNEQVRKIANITTDIKACEIVSQNLKDNESVELSVRQLVAFKFA